MVTEKADNITPEILKETSNTQGPPVESKSKEVSKPKKTEPVVETNKNIKEENKKEENIIEVPRTEPKVLSAKELKANSEKQVFQTLPDMHPLKCGTCGSRPLSSGSGASRTYRCPYNLPVTKCSAIARFNQQQKLLKDKE